MKNRFLHFLYHLKIIGYFIPVLAIGVLGIFIAVLYKMGQGTTNVSLSKLIDIIVPLGFGLQASFLVADEIDHKMEIPMVTQTQLFKLFFSRYLACLILWLSIGTFGVIATFFLSATKSSFFLLFNWVPTAIIISAVACFTSVLSKQSVFGALLALLFWGGMLIGGDSLVLFSPIFTFIHIYLSHQSPPGVYILNRMIVLSLGLFLLYFVRLLLQNEERFFV